LKPGARRAADFCVMPMKKTKILIKITIIFIAHCLLGILLYRSRSVNSWAIAESDIVVFIIPFLLSSFAYGYVLISPLSKLKGFFRSFMLLILSLMLAAISLFTYITVAFNSYGT
jgi:hypothetical protein